MKVSICRAAICVAVLPLIASALHGQAPADTTLPGRVVDVAANEYAFRAPDTIAAGLVTFRLRQKGRVAGGAHLSPSERQALVSGIPVSSCFTRIPRN